jgi:HNH endonuclease
MILGRIRNKPMDVAQFIAEFQDHLAPQLDTYEQAIYLYVFRHSRLVSQDEVVIGFKSARKAIALGIGQAGRPMSQNSCYEKLRSLEQKGCLKIIGTERGGTRVRVRLPSEIPGVLPALVPPATVSLEDMDFFEVPENRTLILRREGGRCFYCLRMIDQSNHVIEHVLSRPLGTNDYRNVVAACLTCNNRKGSSGAEDFLRTLYREQLLSAEEFEERVSHLERLRAGDLRPEAG